MFKLPPRRWEKERKKERRYVCAQQALGRGYRFTQAHSHRRVSYFYFSRLFREGLDFLFFLLPVRNSAAAAAPGIYILCIHFHPPPATTKPPKKFISRSGRNKKKKRFFLAGEKKKSGTFRFHSVTQIYYSSCFWREIWKWKIKKKKPSSHWYYSTQFRANRIEPFRHISKYKKKNRK